MANGASVDEDEELPDPDQEFEDDLAEGPCRSRGGAFHAEEQPYCGLMSREVPEETEAVHVVLLGDSTLDNGRYLNTAAGELSVERQLLKRCSERGWGMTRLAQDGSMLQDVLLRQVPLIPSHATHVVVSASGNDLLALLNEMVAAKFSLSSMYAAIVRGLQKVAERYESLLQVVKRLGCHVACCTVYRPNFSHLFFKSLAALSLGLHNSRIHRAAADLDCSVVDFASLFEGHEDFATPLELSTRGGAKVVENITAFVLDHPVLAMKRYRQHSGEADVFLPLAGSIGMPMRCCATRTAERRVYASRHITKGGGPDRSLAVLRGGARLPFSEAQQRWREA